MSISLVIGPMFAGKSLEVLLQVNKLFIAKKKCLLIRSKLDTRYTDESITDLTACTHNKISAKEIPVQFADTIEECLDYIKKEQIQVVGIDEGQFFSDIAQMCDVLASKLGILVFVAALDGDYMREPFANVSKLIPLCDHVEKIHSVCGECYGQDAIYSWLTKAHTKDDDGGFIVGGADEFKALCRKCHEAKTVASNKDAVQFSIRTSSN